MATSNRLLHMKEYDDICRQFGKMDTQLEQLLKEGDIDKAIGIARSMRGHVAVILKLLHRIKRKEKRSYGDHHCNDRTVHGTGHQ